MRLKFFTNPFIFGTDEPIGSLEFQNAILYVNWIGYKIRIIYIL